MLPDFPRVKHALQEAIARAIRNLAEQHPTLGQIQKVQVFEGHGTALQEPDHKLATPLERVPLPVPLDRQAIIEKGPAAVSEQIPTIAGQLMAAQLRMLVREVTRATDHTGNVVHAGDRPFSQDLYIQMLDRVEMQFDSGGTPSIPELFHPDPSVHAERQRLLEEWMKDPAFVRRIEESIEKQRQKWNDRESNRKLVD